MLLVLEPSCLRRGAERLGFLFLEGLCGREILWWGLVVEFIGFSGDEGFLVDVGDVAILVVVSHEEGGDFASRVSYILW